MLTLRQDSRTVLGRDDGEAAGADDRPERLLARGTPRAEDYDPFGASPRPRASFHRVPDGRPASGTTAWRRCVPIIATPGHVASNRCTTARRPGAGRIRERCPMRQEAPSPTDPIVLRTIRWIARLASLASLAMLALFATSGGQSPTGFEWLLLACFPIGVAIGMIVAWFAEISGGLITLASLSAFHLLHALGADRPPSGPWFAIFAAPGLVLLAVGLVSTWRRRRRGRDRRTAAKRT